MARFAANVTMQRFLAALAVLALAAVGVQAGCDYHTNCASCVADTTCGWCGNDPYSAGGYGMTLQGDHTEGNPFSPDAYMVGGYGKVKQDTNPKIVLGQNTQFTKQFRGYSSYGVDAASAPTKLGSNPFTMVVVVGGVAQEMPIHRVWSDAKIELESAPAATFTAFIPFTLGTPRGSGGLSAGPTGTEVVLPNSASKEQLTVVCTTGNDLPTTPTPNSANACKFTKELKVGYWIVLDKNTVGGVPTPIHRVITSIKSDTELTVDADFTLSNATVTSSLSHSGSVIAAPGDWTYVACPPRIGKRATGVGFIESHPDQSSDFKNSGAIATGRSDDSIYRASGAATLKKHRIVGRGTRFETQMGKTSHWAKAETGGYFGEGPWMSVQINGDWETVKVDNLATTGTYAEYIMNLENSFSEPLLKATHFHWYTMLTKGYGRVRSYGKRVVSNMWSNTEFSNTAGEGTTEGLYGNTRFLTELRTGFTITACGQTRMVNSIQSDVELTIDRPFTLGNREFIAHTGSTAKADDLYVRGLTRLMPLWPRGVTVQIIVTKATSGATPKFKYHVWWKTFKHTDDGDGNSADDQCTKAMITADTDCGIAMQWSTWFQLKDAELQKEFGVYIKWNKIAMGAGSVATPRFVKFDQWKIHVADIENCEYWISTEGERFITDDNANPPVCYNYGKCLPITTDATTPAAAERRPQMNAPGLVQYDVSTFKLTAAQDPADGNRNAKFTSDVDPGDIVRLMVDGAGTDGEGDGKWKDIRVARIVSDTELISDYAQAIDTSTPGGSFNYRILKCAAGRRYGVNHDDTSGSYLPANSKGLAPDETALAYLPHPEHTFYQTWSYKYCEIDPGCCGFRVSSVVQPQQFGYYHVKPDHSNYNLRIAVHTVNDNLDLYTRRDDDGGGRPDTTNYHLTSVRESVPWAIDEDEYDFACVSSRLKQSVLGGATAVAAGKPEEAYHTSLARFVQNDDVPNCEKWVVGVMGDNRYPQTVGASEYSARFYIEFNFPDFACEDSAAPATAVGGFPAASHKDKCVQNNLRFVRDADVVLNNADSPKWVVRLTETKKRVNGQFVKWRDQGGASYPNAQRSGAVWWHRKVHIWDGFETNFVFQITDPSQCGGEDKICDGGDGFAFVITNDDRQEDADYNSNTGWDCETKEDCKLTDGLIGCPADGLGYANSKKSNTVDYFGEWVECTNGLRKALAVEFDTFYNVERRDPKQGKQHWWINATEYVSYNDNHLGVFMTTEPKYAHQPWGAAQPELKALHSDDENGAHFGSTPSVPTMADFQEHTVKIRYTRGFTTEKQGSGKISTTDIVTDDKDRRRLKGNQLTKFKTELRTGFEFGYASRVKANVKVKLNRDITCEDPENLRAHYNDVGSFEACRTSPPVATTGFGDDGEASRVIKIIDDDEANLEDTSTSDATNEEKEVRITYMNAFNPKQDYDADYNIIKEFPGEVQVFIDDMDRYVFQVAVEDRDMSKILDTDGNAYIGFTASTGSKGFAKVGYDPEEVHETHDILAWNYCNNPGCVPY